MGFSHFSISFHLLLIAIASFFNLSLGARKLTSLYQPPPLAITYHNGSLLDGDIPISILWYGKFSPSQKAIVIDFLLSLNPEKEKEKGSVPSVSRWWNTIQIYMKRVGRKETRIVLKNQISDENYSLGKFLNKTQVSDLAKKFDFDRGLTLILTAEEVAVDGFCMSHCGVHGSDHETKSTFIWVGNSVSQCPGQCAWPFHQPIYGPQTPPLLAPNGDVGVDGVIVNIAILLAGTVTNPFGDGYFIGSEEAPLEAASACPGVYGKGAYPGYAGELSQDRNSGGSYNAVGVKGRKYLLPAVIDPSTSQCFTLV